MSPEDTFPQNVWTKVYSISEVDHLNSSQITSDGGYIIAGETSSYGMGGKDIWLLKTNSSGDTVWSKTYGGTRTEVANSVQQTKDGGFIITGEIYFDNPPRSSIRLIKTNPAGDTSWTRTYLTEVGVARIFDYGRYVQQTSDGGYFIAARRGYAHAGYWDCSIYLIKTDYLGNPTAIGNRSHIHMPKNYQLLQNYPNPFNPATTISYNIHQLEFVTLTVFDLQGRKIETLVRQYQKAGKYDVPFNATDLSSGVYFYQLKAGFGFVQARKMILLK